MLKDSDNWDQAELTRARNLARENVVSEGSSVPQSASLQKDVNPKNEKPAKVLDGNRPSTKSERKAVKS